VSRIPRGLLPVLATLLLLALGWTVSLRQVVQVRADMADLLPPGGTPAARLLARELRSGPASSLLIVALEGAEPEHLARVSRALADGMRRSGRFGLVANGAEGLDEGEREFLFRKRYLLSPATTPDAFARERLRSGVERVLRDLSGSAGPLAERYGLADPTGAFMALVSGWAGGSRVEQREGVWFAEGGGRALLLARTGAAGSTWRPAARRWTPCARRSAGRTRTERRG
jgi:predicted exporter